MAATAKKPKQTEIANLPSPALRNKMIEAYELKEEIGEKAIRLKEVLDDCKKMIRESGKRSSTCETAEGVIITSKIVTTGEKVSLSAEKPNKKKKDVDTEVAAV